MKKYLFLVIICFALLGCKKEIEYRDKFILTGPRPSFNQTFTFFSVDDITINKIEIIYQSMTDWYLLDLKYNYYSPVPVFQYPNNSWNPQNTIYYQGNTIIIRGTIETDSFAQLFITALESYKNDETNKI